MKFIKYNNPEYYMKMFARATSAGRRARRRSANIRSRATQPRPQQAQPQAAQAPQQPQVVPINPQVAAPQPQQATPPPFPTPPPFVQTPYKAPERKTSLWQRFKDKTGINNFVNSVGKYYKQNGKNWNAKNNLASFFGQGAKAAGRSLGRAAIVGGATLAAGAATGGAAAIPAAMAARGLTKTINENRGQSFGDAMKEKNLRAKELKRVNAIRKLHQLGGMSDEEYRKLTDENWKRQQQMHDAVSPGLGKGGFRNFLSNTFGLGLLGSNGRPKARQMRKDIDSELETLNQRIKAAEAWNNTKGSTANPNDPNFVGPRLIN